MRQLSMKRCWLLLLCELLLLLHEQLLLHLLLMEQRSDLCEEDDADVLLHTLLMLETMHTLVVAKTSANQRESTNVPKLSSNDHVEWWMHLLHATR
jgi:hypothetical protein